MLDDFDQSDPDNAEFYATARDDFSAYVRSLLDEEEGLNLRDGWVPCTHRWLITTGGSIAGVARLRHRIDTPFLRHEAGHVGYDVAPSHRGHGYGHMALRVAVEAASCLGIKRVLLCISEGNLASRRVAERAGGVLESVSYSEFWNERLCKYWLTVGLEG
jgi:predicted acetyltransferase